ncbi:hypothetical protein ACHAXT_011971 [Thalassiosira profunda]
MSTYSIGGGRDAQAIVADVGSFSTKIGYAGDDHPTAIYNSTTAVVRATNEEENVGSCFVGRPQRDFAVRPVDGPAGDGNYELANPVDPATGWLFSPPSHCHSLSANVNSDGLGDAWESHELVSRYLAHAFRHGLGMDTNTSLDKAKHHPLLLLDRPHTPPALRQRLLEILFEVHDFPAVFLLRDAVASCYAVGRTTATVVDVGYSSTTVAPVYEGFVEHRGVLRNNGCSAKATEERVLEMMDGIVKNQGGRKRRERMKRIQMRAVEKEQQKGGNASAAAAAAGGEKKRDASGHFVKENPFANLAPVPDYLMPIYQVRRAPTYEARKAPFHEWSRTALARDIKEMGLGAAVGPMGYVTQAAAAAAASNAGEEGAEAGAANPLAASSAFLSSSKVPYALPDGTDVEISTASRCDVVELFFGDDDVSVQHRDDAFDKAVEQLEAYETEIEKYLAANDEGEEKDAKDERVGIATSESAANDPYSATSYRGEKARRGRGRPSAKPSHSPKTISAKLYQACLPYVRTAPPEGLEADANDAGINDTYFHHLTSAPPAQMVCDAAFRCDRDQQAALLGNVVVCGGGACLTGAVGVGATGLAGMEGSAAVASALGDEHAFPDRLREEIEAIVHRHTPGWRVKVTSPNTTERAVTAWLGGSILGSLGTFQDMWISRKDYDEFGAAIVNRKCP